MSCVEHQGLVLGEEPGGSMAVARCAGLDPQSQSRDPHLELPFLGSLSMEVTTFCRLWCCAEPCLREGWIWALHLPLGSTELSQGRALSSPALDLSVAPVHGPCLHWGGDQSPRAKGAVCLVPGRCYRTMSKLGPPASPSLTWCETKICVWVPKRSTWAGSTKPGSCKGWLEIFMAPETLLRLCCRLEAKSRGDRKKCVPLSGWGRNVETSGQRRDPPLGDSVPIMSVFGKLGVLGGSQSCTEFTGGWKGEGGLHCLWTALPGRQELWLLLGIFRFSCVIALGDFPLLLVLLFFCFLFGFFFSPQINGTF